MLFRDFLHAARGLKKSAAFVLTAWLTIALGIGASTAIFSVVNAVLLKPLPYPHPERLALIESDLRARNVVDFPLSPPDFLDIKNGATLFEDMGAVTTGRAVVLQENAEPEQIRTGAVTANFLPMLGARLAMGRHFRTEDTTPPPPVPPGAQNPPPVPGTAILSYEYWQRRFGGDPNILGRGIDFGGGGRAQIVGVLAPGFQLLFPPKKNTETAPDIWTALRVDFQNSDRNGVFLYVLGRMKPGVSTRQAQSQADSVVADIRNRFPIARTANLQLRVEPLQEHLVAQVRPALIALMGAVIFLLLIACANVGNLLLVRAAARGRELAVRAALGGSRWDLVRQMLAESLLLAVGGALAGLALARLGIRLLMALAPKNLPRLDSIAIDTTVLSFAMVAAVLAAALFGIIPALRASRPDIADVLRAGGRTGALGRGGILRSAVVTIEVALSFILLIGSGLMIRSFVALTRTDPGFRPEGVLTFRLPPTTARGPEQRAAFVNDFRHRLEALPGVKSVAATGTLPLGGPTAKARWGTAEALADPSRYHQANMHSVTPGYFETLGTRLIAGRLFTDADNKTDQKLMIIDDLFASKAFPHESAVGKRLLARPRTPQPEWFEVIGVVQHVRDETLAADGPEVMYFTDGYMQFGGGFWAIRTEGDPMQLAPLVRAEIAKFDKRLAVADLTPMQFYLDKAAAQTRFALILIAIFAAIAVLLAAVGLYGVLSSAVRQRTAEIGMRMALGAAPWTIFQLVVSRGLRLSAAGVALGILGGLALTRVIASLLVSVKPTDPATFGAMALFFFAIASVACWLPARRAAALDPTVALREE